MSKLNDLITQLCPDGVPYKKLGDLCTIETGRLNANKAVDDGAYPFFTTAEKTSRINSYRWDTEALLIAGNANVGSVKHYAGKFEAYQRTYVLTNFNQDINVRFLFHFTRAFLKKYLANKSNSAAMTYIVLSTLKNFEIPVPPLPVQEEVVRILDSFTTLEAELEAELDDRKEQYEYYRDYLLDKNTLEKIDGTAIETKKLGDIVDILDSKRKPVKRGSRVSGKYPYYGANGIQGYINSYLFDGEFLLVGEDGSVITDEGTPILNWVNGRIWVNNHAHVLQEKAGKQYMLRYIKYALECKNITVLIHGAIPKLNQQMLKSIELPVPSIATQERIVDILDRFDALTTSLTDGIPAEIAMRWEQYEYCRSRLLDFPRLPDGSASVSDGE